MITVFVDLDGALVEERRGRYGPEYLLRPGVAEGLTRLRMAADRVVVLAEELPARPGVHFASDPRLDLLRAELGVDYEVLAVVRCPHRTSQRCDCAKPGTGLIDAAARKLRLRSVEGWHIGGDQEGVQAGRSAGLQTIRIGPAGDDHLSAVHRPDHDARDLLDAANRVLLQVTQGVA
ncbi:MAG TPA: HAD hydrolase-like protein [Candidatus Limnocylindrales bacterium]|nr:HAD hydrolase-like protein [Candidatus Limnocylindrales bacterium]